MSDRPIIFSGPMVRALLNGSKTMTRRVLKPQPPDWIYQDGKPGYSCLTPKGHIEFRGRYVDSDGVDHGPASKFIKLPYAIGDRLWVRETGWFGKRSRQTAYKADGGESPDRKDRWTPSIFMPRWASRLTLTVTDVRVQRLQEISDIDVVAEGVEIPDWKLIDQHGVTKTAGPDLFAPLWNSIHGPDAWDANLWVVALTFTVKQRNIDA